MTLEVNDSFFTPVPRDEPLDYDADNLSEITKALYEIRASLVAQKKQCPKALNEALIEALAGKSTAFVVMLLVKRIIDVEDNVNYFSKVIPELLREGL